MLADEVTFVSTMLNFFATMTMPFLVVYVTKHLKANAGFYGMLLAAFSVGLAVGSVMVGKLRTVRYAGKLFTFFAS